MIPAIIFFGRSQFLPVGKRAPSWKTGRCLDVGESRGESDPRGFTGGGINDPGGFGTILLGKFAGKFRQGARYSPQGPGASLRCATFCPLTTLRRTRAACGGGTGRRMRVTLELSRPPGGGRDGHVTPNYEV